MRTGQGLSNLPGLSAEFETGTDQGRHVGVQLVLDHGLDLFVEQHVGLGFLSLNVHPNQQERRHTPKKKSVVDSVVKKRKYRTSSESCTEYQARDGFEWRSGKNKSATTNGRTKRNYISWLATRKKLCNYVGRVFLFRKKTVDEEAPATTTGNDFEKPLLSFSKEPSVSLRVSSRLERDSICDLFHFHEE